MTTSARHETGALLRAHLSAATSYRHLTRHCPICHQLLRLALEGPHEPGTAVLTTSAAATPPTEPPEPYGPAESGPEAGGEATESEQTATAERRDRQ